MVRAPLNRAGTAAGVLVVGLLACANPQFAATPPRYDAAIDSANPADGGEPDARRPPEPIRFSFPTVRALEGAAVGLAVGDVDGDGRPDLVFANQSVERVVTVVLNLGERRFARQVDYPVGVLTPASIALGDIDGDGDADVVVSHHDGFAVMTNQGDGMLDAPVDSRVTPFTESAALADLDGDGKLDVLTTVPDFNGPAAKVVVSLNLGDLHFAAPVPYVVGYGEMEALVADVDGDRHPDVIATTRSIDNRSKRRVTVLLNRSDGSLAEATHVDVADLGPGLAIGDLNGDGRPDIAVGGAPAHVLANVGLADFSDEATEVIANAVAISDLDRDGRGDLVALGWDDSGMTVLLHPGRGEPLSPVSYLTGGGLAGRVAITDMDGDGWPDLVAASLNDFTVLYNQGNGRLDAPPVYRANGNPVALATGDLNDDGIPDFIAANQTSADVSVLYGRPDGTLVPPINYPVSDSPVAVAVADLNGDARPDVAVTSATQSRVSVLFQTGSGLAAPVRYPVGNRPLAVAVGDFDRDGAPDLAVANHDDGTVTVRRNDGHGSFAGVATYAAGDGPVSIAAGDLTGDGWADLAVACETGSGLRVLPNRGDGTFAKAIAHSIGDATTPQSVAIADIDGDSRLDVALAASRPPGDGPHDNVWLFLNDGGGLRRADAYDTGAVEYGLYALAFADLNGDGLLDLVVGAGNGTGFDSRVNVLMNAGDGTLAEPLSVPVGGDTYASVALTDLDRDGRVDVAVANGAGVVVLRNLPPPATR